jgi:glyoxylase-like metal-dependent hydrolase (beta-lactamase superfamily II)
MPESDVGILDLQYLGQPGRVCAAVVPTRSGFVLVDCGPALTLPALVEGLQDLGLALSELRAVLLTHIHLDHAGAAGELAALAPRATVYVHGLNVAPHLSQPEKLLASVRRLYGDGFAALFGETKPLPEPRMAGLAGGEVIDLDGRRFEVLATPGHASHHLAYVDTETRLLFCGDAAGLRRPGAADVLPYTPPPDIDLTAWEESIDRMRLSRPSALLLTHFGLVEEPHDHLLRFETRLRLWAEVAREIARGSGDLVEAGLEFRARIGPDQAFGYESVADLSHCGRGLVRYWRKLGLSS